MAVARQKGIDFVAKLLTQKFHEGKKRKIEWNWRLPGNGSNEKEMDDEKNDNSVKEATAIDTSSLLRSRLQIKEGFA